MSEMGAIWRYLLGIAVCNAWILTVNCALAQIVPDRTLPNNSSVTINGSIFNITGGTQAGRNLFHSFQQFSVPTGGTASFNNGLDIQNIFSRVTGGSVSNINGVIKALGTANVFFLNPNGIVFGKNASLNIGGSFVATTANAIQFGNQGTFSASVPNNPTLLTVNPSALLYNQITTATSIQNNSIALAGVAPTGLSSSGLRVPDGKSLLLVGGEVTMDGGRLTAYGGRVELGGLTSPGIVGLGVNGNNLSLSFPNLSTRGLVSLKGANVNVAAGGGGSIIVNTDNLNITGGTKLIAGIAPGLGSVGSQGGDIILNATGEIKIDGKGSDVSNAVGGLSNPQNSLTKGNGGNIQITTDQLSLSNGAQLQTATFGQGNVGNVIINATKGVFLDGSGTTIFNTVGAVNNTFNNVAKGNSGSIQITTDQLSLSNSAKIVTSTYGEGNAGNVVVNAPGGRVALDKSGILSTVGDVNSAQNNLAKGNGGNIQITTDQLSLSNGAQLLTSTYGQGNAGNVIINAIKGVVSLDGNNTGFISGSGIVSDTRNILPLGKGGNIEIKTEQLFLSNRAVLRTNTYGKGDAGNITVDSNFLSLTSGAQLLAISFGQGNAGNVVVNSVKGVLFDGQYVNSNGSFIASGIFNSVGLLNSIQNNNVKGNGGNIEINTSQLSLTNGAQIAASTLGQGNAGNIMIHTTKSVSLDGFQTTIFSSVGASNNNQNNLAKGNGGNIQIRTDQLSLSNGAQLLASTYGRGNAGNVIINALSGSVALNKASIFSSVESTGIGNGGSIQITTDELSLTRGARLVSSTFGQGNAGNVVINASKSVSFNGSGIFVNTQGTGDAGNLRINAGSVRLDNGGILSADTKAGQGNIDLRSRNLILSRTSNITTNATGTNIVGGNIKIDTDVLAAVENSKISADSVDFRGGQVGISAQSIFLSSDSSITARGATQQLNGTVQINTPDIDPSHGLVTLPTVTEAIPKLAASTCAAFNEYGGGSNFVITGRGGLPPSPDDPLTSEAIWTDTRLPVTTAQKHHHKTHMAKAKPQPIVIIPATAWVRNDKGEVTLISTATNASAVNTPTSCPVR